MVNLPGPLDEAAGIAVLVSVLESREATAFAINYTARIGRGVRDAVRAVGYERFARLWIPWRLMVSLQVRLFVETVLFSMGKPWSELVSGFKPLRMKFGEVIGPGDPAV